MPCEVMPACSGWSGGQGTSPRSRPHHAQMRWITGGGRGLQVRFIVLRWSLPGWPGLEARWRSRIGVSRVIILIHRLISTSQAHAPPPDAGESSHGKGGRGSSKSSDRGSSLPADPPCGARPASAGRRFHRRDVPAGTPPWPSRIHEPHAPAGPTPAAAGSAAQSVRRAAGVCAFSWERIAVSMSVANWSRAARM